MASLPGKGQATMGVTAVPGYGKNEPSLQQYDRGITFLGQFYETAGTRNFIARKARCHNKVTEKKTLCHQPVIPTF